MDIVLMVLGGLFLFLGLLGCILPIIPGPPLGYVGLLCLHFTERVDFTTNNLVIWAVIAIAITIFDNILPVWATKKFGGSKAGVWGSTIGLIVGLFFPPVGIFVGPFLGAVIGEMLNDNNEKAFKAGLGAFLGFLFGVGLKLMTVGYFVWMYFSRVF